MLYGEENGDYIAHVPCLEACSAFKETPEQALAEAERVTAAWLELARVAGKLIPPPRCWPLIHQAAPQALFSVTDSGARAQRRWGRVGAWMNCWAAQGQVSFTSVDTDR